MDWFHQYRNSQKSAAHPESIVSLYFTMGRMTKDVGELI